MAAAVQAVILAAGLGSRLQERTTDLPKALLPIGPRSRRDATETCFLRRHVELLGVLGVHDIVVVVGHHKQAIYEAVRSWDVPIHLVENAAPDLRASGSLHSLQFAARAGLAVLDGTHRTLVMDADIVFPRKALQRFLDAPRDNALLVAQCEPRNDEQVLVYGSAERPRFLGKGLRPALVAGEPCLGEAVGIVKFEPQDHSLARETLDWLLGDPNAPLGSARRRGFGPARKATEHEELTQRFMHYQKMRCTLLGPELPFMECDDEDDYRVLRETFYPRLLELEAKDGG